MKTISTEEYLQLRIRNWRLYYLYLELRYDVDPHDEAAQRSFQRTFWDLNDSNTPFEQSVVALVRELRDLRSE